MKLYITTYLLLIISFATYSQVIVPPDDGIFHYYQLDSLETDLKSPIKSYYGNAIAPEGEFRILNLFINIIYDQTSNRNPIKNPNTIWPAATNEGINISTDVPDYLTRFMDTVYLPDAGIGSMTRIYRESSFDKLILLGDFVIANIKQSNIPKLHDKYFGYSMHTFDLGPVINEAIRLINDTGGLNTLYGHNQITDYDKFTRTPAGMAKPMIPNNKIDFLQVLIRNTTYKDTTFVYNNDTIKNHRMSWGRIRNGQGYGNPQSNEKILIGNETYLYDLGTVQCQGDSDISKNLNGIVIHEFSHNLFGGNTFHTSGGNHYSGGMTNTFFGLEGGYGLMGAYNSGLVSCNGYERWRMNWAHKDPAINPTGNPIQARHISNNTGMPSDISKEDGPQSFILRDFVTFGDVIRIKLPYKDNGASNQYLWLENHQIGRNDKLDYLNYTILPNGESWIDCRPVGTPGIYAYIQVGKDILDSLSNVVYPTNETDNLRIISADGNWDLIELGKEYADCVNTWTLSRTIKRQYPNPLSGYQDQTTVFFEKHQSDTLFLGYKEGEMPSITYNSNGQLITRSLPNLGDQFDGFSDRGFMGIGTNPTPTNVTTHYVDQQSGTFSKRDTLRDNKHVYLSGLRIQMANNGDGTHRVDVSWDDYDVTQNVRWAGNIVLKEQVILKAGKTITLDQSLTPNQISRDPISNLFVKPTVFRCDEGSMFRIEDYSTVSLKNKSTLLLKTGSSFEIGNNANLVINAGDTLKIDPCAKLIIKGYGRLVVNSGGVLCISPGAIIATDRGMSDIYLNNGFIIPSGYIHPNQVVPPTTSISGNVTWSSKSYHVNNLTINAGAHLTISNSTIRFGQDLSKAVIKPGGKLTVSSSTLSNSCDETWSGIYVEGDRTKTQSFSDQGVLILQNGAVIENAQNAVHMRRVADNWWGNGGIIQATDATFRNNWRDVEFNSYPYPSASFFQNCTFETNSQSLHNQYTSNVSIWNVQGVKFTNCTFQDIRPNIDYYSYRTSRDGIYTIDASFEVSYGCEFIGLKYGIYATATVSNRILKVYDSDFSSYNGIYFSGMDNSHIMNNSFFVKPGYMYSGGNPIETYGLYLENSQNFQVTGNVLTSTGSTGYCKCNSYGIIVRNTGTITQEIYRNDLTGFHIGIKAIGQNRDYYDFAGLQIRCNRFYNTLQTDISVVKDPLLNPIIKQGIKSQQGATYTSVSNTSLAGNIFTPYKWYSNSAEPFGYYHHNTSSHANLLPYRYSLNITTYQKNYNYQYEISCPVKKLSRSPEILLAEMEDGLSGREDTEIQLMEMTDAGNTQLMLQQVEMTGEADAYQTYQHLMKTSPWLSEEVLVALSSREEGFTHAMIRDVLVANPQSAKSEKVNQILNNRRGKLPGFMLAQIKKGTNTFGDKELLEQQLMYYHEKHDMALNHIIRGAMQNASHNPTDRNPALDSLKDLLSQVDDIRYQYLLAELLYSEADYAGGNRIMESIETSFALEDKNEWDNHQKYISFYALLQKWDNEEHPGFSNLPAEALTELETYINTGHRTSGKALAILLQNNAIEYREPIYYPEEEMAAKTTPESLPEVIFNALPDEEFQFRVFPNPGKDYITFEWCKEGELAGNSRIDIYTAAGILMQSVDVVDSCNQVLFSLENLQSGNYIARFISGSSSENISFVVSR